MIVGQRTTFALGGAARCVRLDVGGVGADAEAAESEDGHGGGDTATQALQVGLTVCWILRLELTESTCGHKQHTATAALQPARCLRTAQHTQLNTFEAICPISAVLALSLSIF